MLPPTALLALAALTAASPSPPTPPHIIDLTTRQLSSGANSCLGGAGQSCSIADLSRSTGNPPPGPEVPFEGGSAAGYVCISRVLTDFNRECRLTPGSQGVLGQRGNPDVGSGCADAAGGLGGASGAVPAPAPAAGGVSGLSGAGAAPVVPMAGMDMGGAAAVPADPMAGMDMGAAPAGGMTGMASTGASGTSGLSGLRSGGSGLFGNLGGRLRDAFASRFGGRTEKRQIGACKPNLLLFARGTTEVGALGFTVGPALQSGLGNRDWEVQGVMSAGGKRYAANMAGNNCLGLDGGQVGMIMLEQAVQRCPQQKIVFAGYSQVCPLLTRCSFERSAPLLTRS